LENDDYSKHEIQKINLIDFSKLKKIDPAVIDGDTKNYINKVYNKLFGKQSLNGFSTLFDGICELDKKIKIMFRELVRNEFESNVSLIHWLEKSKYHHYIIISMLDVNSLGKEYWKFSKIRIHHFPVINRYKLYKFKKAIIGTITSILKYFQSESKVNNLGKPTDNLNLKGFQVMFFPHKSLFYDNLFVKDYFYSNNNTSSFNPKNIIHLEYDHLDMLKTKRMYKDYFGFEPHYMSLHDQVKVKKENIYFRILACINKSLIISIIKMKTSLKSLYYMANFYYSYRYFYSAIEDFENVKIALVGYDNLFPVALSLALEKRGIKTLALQERFILPFYNNYAYVIDTQFTASNYISSILQNKADMYCVRECLPTGLIRSDKLRNSRPSSKTKRVVVFDFHIENNFNYQISQPVLNWSNDLFFRKEIVKLAKDFGNYDFIIRGKNIEWTTITYFSEILNEWNNTPNITIDFNYSNFYHSYELCNNSDLIIARHTSIADECISKGFDVILHDYGMNYDSMIRDIYPKIDGINFCHSYEELISYLIFFRKHGYITDPELKKEIINTLFDGLSDGNVQNRITQYLNNIDYQELR